MQQWVRPEESYPSYIKDGLVYGMYKVFDHQRWEYTNLEMHLTDADVEPHPLSQTQPNPRLMITEPLQHAVQQPPHQPLRR
jgi:hypothetical protein